ncbi:MAG: GNAT family N-acetyltransferase, partial [Oscillospiraceae bacterium]|nr:GNAT family N-acetyltransferase [Oscillospiraceae bacterium]
MKNIDISALSTRYEVRALTEADIPLVVELMESNTLYYEYCGHSATAEDVKNDMSALPPGKTVEEKYYLGFFDGKYLMAVMDFIDGYPDENTAFIGFFMVDKCIQGKKIGTAIIEKICLCCENWGYESIMLGYEKLNPQSSHFWQQNGFEAVCEAQQGDSTIVVAKRSLARETKPDFAQYLLAQSIAHPAMKARDALKMCYQAAWGAEHGTIDPTWAKKYLRRELSAVEADGERPIFEQISENLCRVDLRAWKGKDLPWRWLYEIFSAAHGDGDLDGKLSAVAALAGEGKLPFSLKDWEEELSNWDGEAVSHSQSYREAEKPAYRIAPMEYMKLIPILEAMAKRSDGCIVAIDGMSNSGKSSLAQALVKITGAGLVRTDDFLLPGGRRVVEQLGMPGGNLHYDMIVEEVLPHLRSDKAFNHRYFEGHTIRMDVTRRV